jgi:hypothetical protein
MEIKHMDIDYDKSGAMNILTHALKDENLTGNQIHEGRRDVSGQSLR